MSAGGWLILMLFVVGVVILVVKWLQTDSDDSGTIKKPTPEPKPIPVEEKAPDFVTVYQMSSVKNVKICRFCDGENPVGANVCGICGEEIDA